jgi:hypothetical protein
MLKAMYRQESNDEMSRITVRLAPTKISGSVYFWMPLPTSREKGWTLLAHSANSHWPTLAVKSTRNQTNHPKTDVVVTIVARVPVAISRAAVPRIVVPRTAAQQAGLPYPFFSILQKQDH